MKRKRKRPIPILLLWSKGEQLRFINAVESLVSTAHDLAGQVDQLRAENVKATATYMRRKAAREAKKQTSRDPAEVEIVVPAQSCEVEEEGGEA